MEDYGPVERYGDRVEVVRVEGGRVEVVVVEGDSWTLLPSASP
jgi:hypothetical protein